MSTASSSAPSPGPLSGARILVECLKIHGTDRVFCVPGESFLGVLDALYDEEGRIGLTVGRHEATTAHMAEAYGKLTRQPGICFVTRGPGASHAAIAVHTAAQDSTPMLLFVGQVPRGERGREAFQEVDFTAMFGSMAKWVVEITDPARIPELVTRAFHVATHGRPGPVVISIPEDMQAEVAEVRWPAPYVPAASGPDAATLARLQGMLEQAERPMLVLGGSSWSAEAVAQMRGFAERFALPVVAGFRRQDLFDNTHPNYAGFLGFGIGPELTRMIGEADLLLVVGERLGDTASSGYSLIDFPRPAQKLVHVHAAPEELGVLYQPELAIVSSMQGFAAAAGALVPGALPDRSDWIAAARAQYDKHATPPAKSPQHIDMPLIVSQLAASLPEDCVITNGAGIYAGYVHRYFRYRAFGSQLAPQSGAMGYGLPAAIAAQIVNPDRPVVCFAGDGCFLMASHELATAAMYKLPVIVVVVDNASYGSIRIHQERQFPSRISGTDLVNPDFSTLARAYGAHAEVIENTEDFAGAFERARASGGPAVLTVRLDMDTIVAFNPRKA